MERGVGFTPVGEVGGKPEAASSSEATPAVSPGIFRSPSAGSSRVSPTSGAPLRGVDAPHVRQSRTSHLPKRRYLWRVLSQGRPRPRLESLRPVPTPVEPLRWVPVLLYVPPLPDPPSQRPLPAGPGPIPSRVRALEPSGLAMARRRLTARYVRPRKPPSKVRARRPP